MSYGKMIRQHDRGRGRGKSQGGSGKARFKYDWKPGETAELVRFFPGFYGLCGECGGHVSCDAEGNYRCQNEVFGADADGEIVSPLDTDAEIVSVKIKTCGHEGQIDAEALCPVAINYRAFVPGGGKRRKGAMVVGNSWDGRLNKPDLITQYQAETDAPARSHYAHNLVRLSNFHLVEFTNQEKTKTWKQKELCEGKRRCEYCKDKNPEVAERHFGKLEYYNPGYGIWSQLIGWDRVIGEKCKSCDEGHIMTMAFVCNNDDCDHMFIDMDECSLSDEELTKFATSVQSCPECGHEEEPFEIIECYHGEGDDPEPGCEHPVRATLFDVNVKIKRGDKSVQIVGEPELCPIDERVAEFCKPMDFQWLAEMKPDTQAMLMNKDNTFSGGGGESSGKARRSRAVSYD